MTSLVIKATTQVVDLDIVLAGKNLRSSFLSCISGIVSSCMLPLSVIMVIASDTQPTVNVIKPSFSSSLKPRKQIN